MRWIAAEPKSVAVEIRRQFLSQCREALSVHAVFVALCQRHPKSFRGCNHVIHSASEPASRLSKQIARSLIDPLLGIVLARQSLRCNAVAKTPDSLRRSRVSLKCDVLQQFCVTGQGGSASLQGVVWPDLEYSPPFGCRPPAITRSRAPM